MQNVRDHRGPQNVLWQRIGYVQEEKRRTRNYLFIYYEGCPGGWW